MKNRKNGPLFIAPRDENGNKKIWDEKIGEYVVNMALYASPLTIAPIDRNGNKMIWNKEKLVYESKKTGQVFSTISMKFVSQKPVKEPEQYMEDEALHEFEDDEYLVDEDYYGFTQQEEDSIQQRRDEALQRQLEEERQRKEQEILDFYYLASLEEEERLANNDYDTFFPMLLVEDDWI